MVGRLTLATDDEIRGDRFAADLTHGFRWLCQFRRFHELDAIVQAASYPVEWISTVTEASA